MLIKCKKLEYNMYSSSFHIISTNDNQHADGLHLMLFQWLPSF